MTDALAIDRADIAALRAELDRLKQVVQRGGPQQIAGPTDAVAAMAANDFRRMTGPDLDVVPRSHPLGYLEGANYETKQRLKLEAIARSYGGRRDVDPIVPSVYQNDWTPIEEHRWEFALGLRSDTPDPLDRPEKPGTQNAGRGNLATDVQARQGRRPAT